MEDEPLNLDAWAAPPAPRGLADAVIARVNATDEAIAVVARRRRVHRRWWIAGGLAAAIATLALVVVPPRFAPKGDDAKSGAWVAVRPRQLVLPGAIANLDPGTSVSWQQSGEAIHVDMLSGAATWRVDDRHLFLDVGAAVASIEASNATLRVETRMNLSDARVVGAAAVTSVAMALVTVVVYEGHIKLSGAGQTVVVQPGVTYVVTPGHAPTQNLDDVDRVVDRVVELTSGDLTPHAAATKPELVVPIGETVIIHDPYNSIEVAIDTKCASDPKLLWVGKDHARLARGSYQFSHVCDGVEHRGSIRVVDDARSDVLRAPEVGAHWTLPLSVLGAHVPNGQVTVDGISIAPSDQKYWLTEVTPKHAGMIAVRVDTGDNIVQYYIRRDAPADRTAARNNAPDLGMTAAEFEAAMKQLEPSLALCVKGWPAGQDVAVEVSAEGRMTDMLTTGSEPTTDACLRTILRSAQFPKAKAASRRTYHVEAACNVDELLATGTGAVARGEHQEALKSYDAALRCKFDVHSLQLAFMAACRAPDVNAARKYWKRMTADMKSHLLQMCLRSHITEQQLDE